MAEGSRAVHPLSLEAPAVLGRHVSLHPSLVDEHQLSRIRPAPKVLPLLVAALRVGAVALVCHRRQLLASDVAGFQKAPNRGDARRDASPAKPVLQTRQGDRRIGIDSLKDPRPLPRQLRRAARAHPARTDRSRVQKAPNPFNHA